MMLAWLRASLTMASSGPSSVSNSPPLASKQEEYRIAASLPRKRAMASSRRACTVCVPQMKRTDDMP